MEQVDLRHKSIEALTDERRTLVLQRRKLLIPFICLGGLVPGLIGILFASLCYYFLPPHSWIHQWSGSQISAFSFIGFFIALPLLTEASRTGEQIRQVDWEFKDRAAIHQVQEITTKISSGVLKPNPHLR